MGVNSCRLFILTYRVLLSIFHKIIMLDLKAVKIALEQLETERGIPKEKIIDAIEQSLAAAYKKDYGKRGQTIRAHLNMDTGETEFFQVRLIVSPDEVRMPENMDTEDINEKVKKTTKKVKETGEKKDAAPVNITSSEEAIAEELIRFNPEHHIFLEDAKKIKKDAKSNEEIVFPLEVKDDFGRIAAQTAKQVIVQRIREAEKESVVGEYGNRRGEIVSGTVQRIERNNIYVDLGRAIGFLPYAEQIPGERYRQGESIRAYLFMVEDSPRGISLKLSRSHPKFIEELFKMEAPEVASGAVIIKSIAREAGARSKIAVLSEDEHIDPVGACVGPKGVRVSTVMSELHGEKIDIIEWSENTIEYISGALSPASVMSVEIINNERGHARATVREDQLSLAIGKGGQNVRLAAKLTGWKIDIASFGGDTVAESDEKGKVEINENKNTEAE